MTSATDELRRLLDERGVEYAAEDEPAVGLHFTLWDTDGFMWEADDREERVYLSADRLITPEQAIAATLGGVSSEVGSEVGSEVCGGKLTAEHVREAVNGHGNIMDNRLYCDWQAIANELNATLGSEECELTYGETDNGVDSWFTQCGGRFNATFEDGRMVHPEFCQLCGGKAVKR